MEQHFVQVQIGSKILQPTKISTDGCGDIDDFKEAIKTKFSRKLKSYDACELALFEADGTTAINPMDSIDKLNEKSKPLVAIVEPDELEVVTTHVSSTRHQYYNHSKAVYASRSYLARKRYVTIEDVMNEAHETNPEPYPQFSQKYKKLNDFFTVHEWNVIEILNYCVNPKSHNVLSVHSDGKSKEVVLPIEVSHLGADYQRIAKKSNVVEEFVDLIVKNEGSRK